MAIDEHDNRKPVVTRTQHIFDYNLEKNQAEINADIIARLEALEGNT